VAGTLKKVWRVAKALARAVVYYAPIAFTTAIGYAAENADEIISNIASRVSLNGPLSFAVGGALFGAGLILRFLPWGSAMMKSKVGQLIDDALILAGLGSIGLGVLAAASEMTVAYYGQGTPFKVQNPWEIPRPS
jgi:hypothetical protein